MRKGKTSSTETKKDQIGKRKRAQRLQSKHHERKISIVIRDVGDFGVEDEDAPPEFVNSPYSDCFCFVDLLGTIRTGTTFVRLYSSLRMTLEIWNVFVASNSNSLFSIESEFHQQMTVSHLPWSSYLLPRTSCAHPYLSQNRVLFDRFRRH